MQSDTLSICGDPMPFEGSLMLVYSDLEHISGSLVFTLERLELIYGEWAFIYGAMESCGIILKPA